ncbi:hypothetical protein BRC83_09285 [Halobacteriales archaeon QS_1_68_17]|nr:MAG: hypothetical protein BRC83_09285 [Halobacteriales archaeon QS_1_68_17]
MVDAASDDGPVADAEPVVSCECQGGTVSVYEDRVLIERSSRSMFEDKTIPMMEISGVEYTGGIVSGHLQIQQSGFDHDDGGFLTHPVDANTLYFPRAKRECARRARDEILSRALGE